MMQFFNRYWHIILVSIIAIVFLISRFMVFGTHFTHYDDIFGPYLIKVIANYDAEYFASQVTKYGVSLGAGMQDWIINNLIENDLIFTFIKRMIGALSISLVSTFAPLQFIFTALILNFDLPYEDFIKIMRLPSLISAFASFACLIYFTRLFSGQIQIILMTCGTLLLTISWMLIIYASQSENFMLGLFAVFIMFFLIERYAHITPSFNYSILLGIGLSILCFSHYQVIFFLPGFYLGYLFACKPQNYIKRFISLVPAGLINLVSVAIIYFLFLSERLGVNPGVHWNAGLNQEFVWQQEYFLDGYINFFTNFFSFFLINAVKVMYGIFGFRESFDGLSISYACFLLLISLYGLYQLYKSEDYRNIFIFIITTMLIWIGLVLAMKLTFSPTRHSIALIPIVIILFSFGLDGVFTKLKLQANIRNTFIILFCSLSLAGFLSSFSKIHSQRINPFLSDVDVLSLIKEHSVVKIAAIGYTGDLNFYPEIADSFEYYWSNKHPFTHVYQNTNTEHKINDKKSIMIVCANSPICGIDRNEFLALSELDEDRAPNLYDQGPLYQYSKDSEVTNGFSNMAGSGTRRIFLKIYQY